MVYHSFKALTLTFKAAREFCDLGFDSAAASSVAAKYTPKINARIAKTNDSIAKHGVAACDPDIAEDFEDNIPLRTVTEAEVAESITGVAKGCDGVVTPD